MAHVSTSPQSYDPFARPPTAWSRHRDASPSGNDLMDVAIIGGGIIGRAIAAELTRRGQRVVLHDAGPRASTASWAASGSLPAPALHGGWDPLEGLRRLSHAMYADWC